MTSQTPQAHPPPTARVDWRDAARRLAAPFHSYYVGWKAQAISRDKSRALAVPYIDARAVMDRLDAVVGPGHWSDAYRLVSAGDGEFAIECTLLVYDVPKSDVGIARERDDGRRASPAKSAYSDALKRAAVKWGIGRYIYRVPGKWVGYDAARKQLTETPELPAWALPGGTPAAAEQAPDKKPSVSDDRAARLTQARATVLPFGTRDHPEWRGKTLGEVSVLNAEIIPWLATEFTPTSDGGRTVQHAARILHHAA